jgi:tetratricopeptide (TPR) repeat protein
VVADEDRGVERLVEAFVPAAGPARPGPAQQPGRPLHPARRAREGLASYLDAIRIAPESYTAYYNAVGSYRHLNRFDEAHALLDRAVEVFGVTPSVRIARFHLALAQRDMQAADEEARALAGTSAAPIVMLSQMTVRTTCARGFEPAHAEVGAV